MKRQSIRKTLLFLSFLFFPVTLYYLSPVISLSGAYYGVISGSLIVFVVLFVISMFTGRGFCAWVCPAGGLQECFSVANGNRPFRIGWKNWIKYVIWVPWFSSIVVLLFLSGGKTQTHFFYQLSSGISILEDFALIIYFSMTLLMVILAIAFGKRAFCHMICWMAPFMVIGKKIRRYFHIPALSLVAESSACTGCNRCTKNCSMSINVKELILSGAMEHPECILCGECVDTCTKKAIRFRFTNN